MLIKSKFYRPFKKPAGKAQEKFKTEAYLNIREGLNFLEQRSQREFFNSLAAVDRPRRVLLHVCCGPCAIIPASKLLDEGAVLTGLFYNPNIHPTGEYLRRRDTALQVADRLGFPLLLLDEETDPSVYFRRVAGNERNRCFHCYHIRLERTESLARSQGFDSFTSTLLYSRFQKYEMILSLGRVLARDNGPRFLDRDFRPGWSEGIRLSKDWGLYRQNYCGCLFSEWERFGPNTGR